MRRSIGVFERDEEVRGSIPPVARFHGFHGPVLDPFSGDTLWARDRWRCGTHGIAEAFPVTARRLSAGVRGWLYQNENVAHCGGSACVSGVAGPRGL